MKMLAVLAGITALLLVARSSPGMGEPYYPPDNSDWWSLLGHEQRRHNGPAPRDERLPASNFTILGINFGNGSFFESGFAEVEHAIDAAPIVERGDAGSSRSQICFKSDSDNGRYKLIFERGEVSSIAYMLDGGPEWKGADKCVASNKITEHLATKSGIHLGMSVAEAKAILGKASSETNERIEYDFMHRVPLTSREMQASKGPNGGLISDYYAYWWASIVIGFRERRASYVAMCTGETT